MNILEKKKQIEKGDKNVKTNKRPKKINLCDSEIQLNGRAPNVAANPRGVLVKPLQLGLQVN